MENEQHIDIQEVTYFQGTLGENKDINCIITNKKMDIPRYDYTNQSRSLY